MTISHSPLRRKRRGWWQPGNVTTGNIFVSRGSPVGVDVEGVWRDWDFAVTSGGIPWAGSDDVGRWIAPNLSGGYLGADTVGRWMEVATVQIPVGVDDGGAWIDWDLYVNADGITRAGVDDGGRWIDPELFDGYLGADAIGRWMEFS